MVWVYQDSNLFLQVPVTIYIVYNQFISGILCIIMYNHIYNEYVISMYIMYYNVMYISYLPATYLIISYPEKFPNDLVTSHHGFPTLRSSV